MNTTIQILPGIRFIGYVDCLRLQLAGIANYGLQGIPVGVFTEVKPIDFFDDPECRNVTEFVNGQRQDKVTLKFHSHSLIEIHKKLGFVVTDANGKSYLIGALERPYPVVKTEMMCGAPDGDGGGFYYEVTHEALCSMVPCKF